MAIWKQHGTCVCFREGCTHCVDKCWQVWNLNKLALNVCLWWDMSLESQQDGTQSMPVVGYGACSIMTSSLASPVSSRLTVTSPTSIVEHCIGSCIQLAAKLRFQSQSVTQSCMNCSFTIEWWYFGHRLCSDILTYSLGMEWPVIGSHHRRYHGHEGCSLSNESENRKLSVTYLCIVWFYSSNQ